MVWTFDGPLLLVVGHVSSGDCHHCYHHCASFHSHCVNTCKSTRKQQKVMRWYNLKQQMNSPLKNLHSKPSMVAAVLLQMSAEDILRTSKSCVYRNVKTCLEDTCKHICDILHFYLKIRTQDTSARHL